jgi:hypothetical protein
MLAFNHDTLRESTVNSHQSLVIGEEKIMNRQGAKHAKGTRRKRRFFNREKREGREHRLSCLCLSKTRAGMPVPPEFPCGNAAGPIDGDCLTTL